MLEIELLLHPGRQVALGGSRFAHGVTFISKFRAAYGERLYSYLMTRKDLAVTRASPAVFIAFM
jgi:hypothetical protein